MFLRVIKCPVFADYALTHLLVSLSSVAEYDNNNYLLRDREGVRCDEALTSAQNPCN